MNTDTNTSPAILIVDDIPTNLNLLRHLLEPGGYQVLGATNGATGLQIAARALPQLILLDVSMPEMDGFEVCRRLKADETTRNIPVLFVTARSEPEAILEGFQVGAVDYVVKPFSKEEVLARVRTHLQIADLTQSLARRNVELETLAAKLQSRQEELELALTNIRTLRGLLPICANCKKIRDDRGFWQQVESYVSQHSDARFSHGICPDCLRKLYPQYVLSQQLDPDPGDSSPDAPAPT